MRRTRIAVAVLAIVVMIAAALVPGGASHAAVPAVALLLLPATAAVARQWMDAAVPRRHPAERVSVLLRAPPAPSVLR